MIDTKQLLDKFMNSGVAGGLAGGLASGALTGLLASKDGRKMAGSALKVGGVALAGGLAYKAYQSYRNKQDNNASGLPGEGMGTSARLSQETFIPPGDDTAAQQSLGLLLLRAMISAAKADGNIDSEETSKILSEINRLGLEAEEKALLFDEYARPLDVQLLVKDVQTPEQAIEVYAASLLAVGSQNAAETRYLHELARALNLEPALVDEIERTVAENMIAASGDRQVA